MRLLSLATATSPNRGRLRRRRLRCLRLASLRSLCRFLLCSVGSINQICELQVGRVGGSCTKQLAGLGSGLW